MVGLNSFGNIDVDMCSFDNEAMCNFLHGTFFQEEMPAAHAKQTGYEIRRGRFVLHAPTVVVVNNSS